jgi:hypothetical protein
VQSALQVTEPARLLHARSEYGYTPSVALALVDEPEAVPEDAQRELTRQAAARAASRRRAEWQRQSATLWAVVAELERALLPDLTHEVRALARDVARLDRKLA